MNSQALEQLTSLWHRTLAIPAACLSRPSGNALGRQVQLAAGLLIAGGLPVVQAVLPTGWSLGHDRRGHEVWTRTTSRTKKGGYSGPRQPTEDEAVFEARTAVAQLLASQAQSQQALEALEATYQASCESALVVAAQQGAASDPREAEAARVALQLARRSSMMQLRTDTDSHLAAEAYPHNREFMTHSGRSIGLVPDGPFESMQKGVRPIPMGN